MSSEAASSAGVECKSHTQASQSPKTQQMGTEKSHTRFRIIPAGYGVWDKLGPHIPEVFYVGSNAAEPCAMCFRNSIPGFPALAYPAFVSAFGETQCVSRIFREQTFQGGRVMQISALLGTERLFTRRTRVGDGRPRCNFDRLCGDVAGGCQI